MKILLFTMFILICQSLQGQTKNETKNWIIEKHDNYRRLENSKNEIKFEDNNIIYLKYFYGYQYEKISIKNIREIGIKKVRYPEINEECYVLTLKGIGKEYGYFENAEYTKTGTYENEEGEVTILLNIDFGEDDLPKRMEKALIKLITLHGGKPKKLKETF